MKKTKAIVLILIMVLIIIFPLTINATGYQIQTGPYEPEELDETDAAGIGNYAGVLIGVVQIVGTMVSAATLIIIGIRYVIGSVEEKAEYKERMIPYIIGAVLIFGASNVVKVLYIMSNNSV